MTAKGLVTLSSLVKEAGLPLKSKKPLSAPYSIRVASLSSSKETSHVVHSGYQNVVKVTTDNGRSVTCTPNEPFLVFTPEGTHVWKEAASLSLDDWVCLKRDSDVVSLIASKAETPIPGVLNSKHLFSILGYLVGDGFINKGQKYIGFCQVNPEVCTDFERSWNKAIPFKLRSELRKPHSYGMLPVTFYNCNSVEARDWFSKLGLLEGNSYDRKIPDIVWTGSKSEVSSFLRSLFECDGTISLQRNNTLIHYISCSRRLLSELSLLLQNYFGIFTTVIYEDSKTSSAHRISIIGTENVARFIRDIGFRSQAKRDKCVINTARSQSRNDVIPYASSLGISRGYDKTPTSLFRAKFESGNFQQLDSVYERNYFYTRVKSVSAAGKRYVYDLTVPKSHAFVANGFVVHNTNCRLSKFGDHVFFDPNYIEISRLVPNYDGKDLEPMILPCLLPNVLINGAFGIAVGVTTQLPSYTPQSLAVLIKRILKGETVGPAECYKFLKFNYKYGGDIFLEEREYRDELRKFYKTGFGKATFTSTYTWDEKKRTMTFTRFAPDLNPDKMLEKMGNHEFVQDASNLSSKNGYCYVVTVRPAKSKAELEERRDEIAAAWETTIHFKTNVTERFLGKNDEVEVRFRSTTIPALLHDWVTWRVLMEKASLVWRMSQIKKAIDHTNLLLLAIKNKDIIRKSWEVNDQEAFLSKQLKITVDQAKIITEMKIRQLSKLDAKALMDKLKFQKEEETKIAGWQKAPEAKIVSDIDALLKAIA